MNTFSENGNDFNTLSGFYYPPNPIRGGPPRAALSGGGLAQTPRSAHP